MIRVSLAYENVDIEQDLPAVPRTGDYLSLHGTAEEDHHLIERVCWQRDNGTWTVTLFMIDERVVDQPAYHPDPPYPRFATKGASQTQ